MKITLIHPFYNYCDEEKSDRPFPFGIAYVASYLLRKGHEVEILDLNEKYLKKDELAAVLKKMRCDAIGISALSIVFTYVKNLIALIKDTLDVPVIVGGPLGTHNPQILLEHTGADICVIGQGEKVTCDILENIHNLNKVDGIVYKNAQGQILQNLKAPIIPADEIPLPAYRHFDMEKYIWNAASADMDYRRRYAKGLRVAQVITGRGCPMRCNFCSKVMGNNITMRSVDKVIEEIKFLIKEYRINAVSFRDELYLMNKQRAYELASKLKPLNLIWMGQGRVDRVDYDLIKYMKECGCISLGFGIESGSPKMLKLINKGQTVAQIEQAVRSCQRLDMDMKVQLVMGYPGEDKSSIEETIDLFKRLGHPGRRFHLITPLPGSTLYEDLLRQKVITDELQYLIALSKRDSGFSRGKPLINLTGFSDEELYSIKLEAETRMYANYRNYILRHPNEIIRYLKDRFVYKGYLFNPLPIVSRLTRNTKISEESRRKTRDKIKWEEYQL